MFACCKVVSKTRPYHSKLLELAQRHLSAASSSADVDVSSQYAAALGVGGNNNDDAYFNNSPLNEFGQAKPQLAGEKHAREQNFDDSRNNASKAETSSPGDAIRYDKNAFADYCAGDGLLYEDRNIIAFDKPHDIGKVDNPQGVIGVRSSLVQLSDRFRCRNELRLISMPEPRCSGVVLLSKTPNGLATVQQAFRRGINRLTFHSMTFHALCNIPALETLKRFQPVVNDTVYFRPVQIGTETRYQVMPRNIFDKVTKREVKLGKYDLDILNSFTQPSATRRSDAHVKRRQKKSGAADACSDQVQYEDTRAVIILKTSGDDWYLYRIYCAFSGFPIVGDEVYGPQAQSVFGLPVLKPPAPVDKSKHRKTLCLHLHRIALAGYKKGKEDLIIETKVMPRWYPDYVNVHE